MHRCTSAHRCAHSFLLSPSPFVHSPRDAEERHFSETARTLRKKRTAEICYIELCSHCLDHNCWISSVGLFGRFKNFGRIIPVLKPETVSRRGCARASKISEIFYNCFDFVKPRPIIPPPGFTNIVYLLGRGKRRRKERLNDRVIRC